MRRPNFCGREFRLDFTEDLRLSMSEFDATAAALREIDLALQHHGRTNKSVGPPPVIHLNTEYLRFQDMFYPNQMRAFVDEHLPNLTTEQKCDSSKYGVFAFSGYVLS